MFDRIKVEVGRYIVSSCWVHTVFEPSENTIIILYSWIPLNFGILSHVYQFTTPLYTLYLAILYISELNLGLSDLLLTVKYFVCLFFCLLHCRNSIHCEQKVNHCYIDRDLLRSQHHLRVHRGQHHQAGTTSPYNNIHTG